MGIHITLPSLASAAPATWSTHPSSDDAVGWRGVVWAPELHIFVAVGTGANGAMTSPDGITWTPRATPDAAHIWRGIAWSPALHLFAAVGTASGGTTTVMTSPDGISWTLRDPGVIGTFMGITWSPEQAKFVATAAPASGALISTDGITWSSAPTPPVGGRNVVWSAHDNQYVSVRSPATNAYTSPDGNTWTAHTTPINSLGIAYSEAVDAYVAVGAGGIISSADGITWTSQTSPVTNLRSIAWSPEIKEFVATGPGGIVTSPDGITWSSATSPAANTWEAIAWSAELSRYVAVSSDGTNRTMTGLVPALPGAPLNLTAATEGLQINLIWAAPVFDGNTVITGYRIERSTNGGPFTELTANTGTAATTYADTNLTANTTYTYRVYALNAQGQSIASNNASVQTSAATAALANTGSNQKAMTIFAAVLLVAGVSVLVKFHRY